MSNTINLKTLERSYSIKSNSYDAEKRTFEVVFTTGQEVKRGYWDIWYERLTVDEESLDLSRLKNGAPFLAVHDAYRLNSVIGVVEDAWIADGKGYARIRLSDREDVEPVARDIENGILRNISVGYSVERFQDESEHDDQGNITKRILRATKWQAQEISLVPVGADSECSIRAGEKDTTFTAIIERSKPMGDKNNNTPKDAPQEPTTRQPDTNPTQPTVDVAKIEREAIARHEKRNQDILEATKKAGLDAEFARNLQKDTSLTIDQAREAIINELARKNEKDFNPKSSVPQVGQDHTETRIQQMQDALLHRYDMNRHKLDEKEENKYRNLSLLQLARIQLSWTLAGETAFTLSNGEVAKRAMQGSTDFAKILENITGKTLRDGYVLTRQTFWGFTRRRNASNFKELSSLLLGQAPGLVEVPESGEFETGVILESGEKYSIKTFGRIVALTRKTIIDDDLGAFTKIPFMYGHRAAELESNLVWNHLINNVQMSDGKAIFHVDHGNIATGADRTAVSVDSLSKARLAMGTHKDIDGETFIDIPLQFVAAGITQQTHIEQLLAKTDRQKDSDTADYNPFGKGGSSEVQQIVERRLESLNSGKGWLGISSPQFVDIMEVATLEGATAPYIETWHGRDIDGIKIKARYDFGSKLLDHRGVYYNKGENVD